MGHEPSDGAGPIPTSSLRRPHLRGPQLLPLIALLVVVATAVVAAEWWLRSRGVQLLATRIADSVGAGVEVSVTGLPLLWHLLRRNLPHVEVRMSDVPIAAGRSQLEVVVVRLDHVRLSGPWRGLSPTFGDASFTAETAWGRISPLVPVPPYLRAIDVAPSGLKLTTLAGVVVDARVDLRPGEVIIRPTGGVLRLLPQPNVRIELPPLPFGAEIAHLDLHVDRVGARGPLDPEALARALRRT